MKKIFDILPPKKILIPKKKITKKRTLGPVVILLCSILLFFSLAFLIGTKFSKVKITIFPKKETHSFQLDILAATSTKEIKFDTNEISAFQFRFDHEIKKSYQATGKVLTKAEGKIRLFNSWATFPEVWREGTRFISSEGKIFKSKNKIFVPPATIERGKIIPSFIDVEVEAAEGGSDYNIGPSKFAILVFRGTEKYSKYWGESFEPMKGGGEVKVITKEDIEIAQQDIEKSIKKEVEGFLATKISDEFLLLENAYSILNLEKILEGHEGEKRENFFLNLKITIETLTFKRKDAEKLIKNFLVKNLPPQKELIGNSIYFSFLPKKIDPKNGKLEIKAKIEFKTLEKLDVEKIKKELEKKDIEEAKIFLYSYYPIENVIFEKSIPFLKKLPSPNKIQIKVFVD